MAKDGPILIEEEQIRKRWEEYVEELYNDNRKEKINFLLTTEKKI